MLDLVGNPEDRFSQNEAQIRIRVRWDEQSFLPNSLPKLHATQSTVTIFHDIIMVSQYRKTVKTVNYDIYSE